MEAKLHGNIFPSAMGACASSFNPGVRQNLRVSYINRSGIVTCKCGQMREPLRHRASAKIVAEPRILWHGSNPSILESIRPGFQRELTSSKPGVDIIARGWPKLTISKCRPKKFRSVLAVLGGGRARFWARPFPLLGAAAWPGWPAGGWLARCDPTSGDPST